MLAHRPHVCFICAGGSPRKAIEKSVQYMDCPEAASIVVFDQDHLPWESTIEEIRECGIHAFLLSPDISRLSDLINKADPGGKFFIKNLSCEM